MSAINILVQSDRVQVLTDAAAYLQDGTITAFTQKQRMVPHLNCVIAARGAALGVGPVFDVLQLASTFDELREGIVETLKATFESCAPLFKQCDIGPDFEVVVAGISETNGPSAYLVASHCRYGDAWVIRDLPGLTALPCDESLLQRVQEIVPPGTTPDDVDLARDGLAIMEVQRAWSVGNKNEVGAVGGFAQLSVVSASGASSRVIHRWADCLGSKVAA